MAGDFASNFIDSYSKGVSAARARREEENAREDREIEKELLQHRVKELEIQERVQARQAAEENFKALDNQPENNFIHATDADVNRVTMSPIPGQVPQEGRVAPNVPSVNIPGIDELGIPGVTQQPKTFEQHLADTITGLRAHARNTAESASYGENIYLPGQNPGDKPELLAAGEQHQEPLVNYTTRDANGVERTERITQEEAARRGPAVKQPIPRRGGSGGTGQLSKEEIDDTVDGVKKGLIPIDALPKTAAGLKVQSRLAKDGFDSRTALLDLRAFRTHLNSLNEGQQQNVFIAADTAEQALQSLEAANKSLVDSKFDFSKLPGAASGAYGKDAQAAANEIANNVKVVQDSLGIIKAGGSQAGDKAMEDALAKFSAPGLLDKEGWGPRIKRVRDILQYRTHAIRGSFVSADQAGLPGASGGATGGGGGGTGASTGAGPSDADIAAALKAKKYPFDAAAIAKVKGNAAALKELGLTQ